jgi:hypothetical protein
MTERARQLGQDNLYKTTGNRTGHPGQDIRDRTAGTCQPGELKLVLTGQTGQTERTGRPEHDRNYMTARREHPDRTAWTGDIGRIFRTRQHGQDSKDSRVGGQECRDRLPGPDSRNSTAGTGQLERTVGSGQPWQDQKPGRKAETGEPRQVTNVRTA